MCRKTERNKDGTAEESEGVRWNAVHALASVRSPLDGYSSDPRMSGMINSWEMSSWLIQLLVLSPCATSGGKDLSQQSKLSEDVCFLISSSCPCSSDYYFSHRL